MDNRNGFILTDKGRELLAKVEAEAGTLNLTRCALGDGTVDSIDEYRTATGLVSQKYSMLIAKKEHANGLCAITVSISSDSVDESFYPYELGIFAEDDGAELLFGIAYDDSPRYIPGKNEGVSVENEYPISFAFSDSATIEVTLPVTQEEIVQLVQNNAVNAVNAATAAASSESNAKAAADRAETEAQNAALSESNAKASEESAKKTASSIADATAADVKTATEQAQSAAASAQSAQDAESTAQELYHRFCVDIVGPPASAMNDADLFVAPGAAAMAAMGR